MSDVGVRKMIARAKARGYVTYDELNKVLPSEKMSSEQIEDTMSMLNEMGINVIESEEQEEGAEGESRPPLAETGKEVVATTGKATETYDRTDDPVRMYLREMGSVELLSREGEIAIAKRIEAGRDMMIGALCEVAAHLRSPHGLARRTERRQSPAARHHRSGSDLWRRARRPGRRGRCCRRRRQRVGPDGKPLPPPMHIPGVHQRTPVPPAFVAPKPAPPPAAQAGAKADGEEVDPAKRRPPPMPPTTTTISRTRAICRSPRWKPR